MDEKTADLRDLFVETTGEETVTDSQSTPRGSLGSDRDEAAVAETLEDVVETMRDRYDFASSLSTADHCRVVRAFYDHESGDTNAESWSAAADAALASSLPGDVDTEAVFRARMDLHLVSDADREGVIPYERLRKLVSSRAPDVDDEALAGVLSEESNTDVDVATARRYRRVVETDIASRRVNHRFRDAFTDLLTDADLSTRLAEDARRDGLGDATEDIETDVSL